MGAAIIGRKVGMTRLYDESGKNIPVTIIQAGPCYVSQIKTAEPREDGKCDGYDAVQLAFEDVKARNSTIPQIGHDGAAGISPKRVHREFRLTADEVAELELGQEITVERFEDTGYVDVIGTSKGKGFAGPMKRHGFKGLCASHGTERKHRSPGSIGGRAAWLGGGRPKKGIRMGGQMGNAQVTARAMDVVSIDKEKGLLIVKGPVPGPNGGLVEVQKSRRVGKVKQNILKAKAS